MEDQFEKSDQIGDFGLLIERRSLQNINGNAMRFQCAEIDLQIRHRTHEDRYFAPRFDTAGGLPLLQQTRHGLSFHLAAFTRPDTRLGGDIRYPEERRIGLWLQYIGFREANAIRKIDFRTLNGTDLAQTIHHRFRQAIRKFGDRSSRSIILLQMFEPAPLIENAFHHAKENRHSCAPKPVYGLFRIGNNHQLTARQALRIIRVLRQQGNDLGLNLIRILEFVNENRLEMILVVPSNAGITLQEVSRAK